VEKILNIEDATALVPDGSTLALGGLSMNSSPMAFVRELIRQGKKDLTLVAIVNGMAVDWLVAAGCVRRVISGLISFEGMGLAPNFRNAIESGTVTLEEYSEYLLIARLRAAATNLPFIPTKAGLGTDVIGLHPETTRLETDPVTGEAYVACTPLPVDVAVVHAHAADVLGNVRVDPKLLWMDNEIVPSPIERLIRDSSLMPSSKCLGALIQRRVSQITHTTRSSSLLIPRLLQIQIGSVVSGSTGSPGPLHMPLSCRRMAARRP